MATARDKNGYTPCETMDTSTAKLKDVTIINDEGCKPDCQYKHLRELSSESACEQCDYEKQLDANGYAHFDISTYRPSYYRYRPKHDKKCPSTWKIVVLVLVILSLVIGALILGYYLRQKGDESESTLCPPASKTQLTGPPLDYHHLQLLHENLMYSITGDKIAKFFRNYTGSQIYTGSDVDKELTSHIRLFFTQLGLRETGHERQDDARPYRALVSFPDPANKNTVQVLDEINGVLFEYVPGETSHPNSRPTRNVQSGREDPLQPFVSYSASGTAQGKLLYLNYGSRTDYVDVLAQQTQLEGRIALIRLGNIAVEKQVRLAEEYGIAGILLFADPEDALYHQLSNCDHTVPYVTANDDTGGDPNTPGLPAYEEFASAVEPDHLPLIPAQTISCLTAAELLGNMTGRAAPVGWRGGITGIRYTIEHEGNENQTISLNVWNTKTTMSVYNVIGTLTGEEDPDQYVIVGASRSSFGLSDSDSIVGTSLLLVLAEQLNFLMEREGWRPNRSIKLISWGGAELGNIGMVEYLEEYEDIMRDRIVAYIDLDQAVSGTYMPYIEADNILTDILYNVAQRVPSPDDLQSMLYNTWAERASDRRGGKPVIGSPSTTTAFNPFSQHLRVPTAHWQYVNKDHKTANQSLLTTEAQRLWPHHAAVGRLSGLLALSLADASVLQYNTVIAAATLRDETVKFIKTAENIPNKNVTKGLLKKEVENILSAANAMEYYISNQLDFGIHSHRRVINERLLQFQSFTNNARIQLKILSQEKSKTTAALKEDTAKLLKYLRSAAFVFRLEL